MMSLNIHQNQDRCLFNNFNATNDMDPISGKMGIKVYQNKLSKSLFALFGYAIKLKGQNQQVHYVNRKSLKKWIERYKGHVEGSIYEKITEICKKQALANCKKMLNEKRTVKMKERINFWHAVFIQKLKTNRTVHIQNRHKTFSFKIAMIDRTFIATQAKMEKSAYFNRLFSCKESKNRFIFIKFDHGHGLAPSMIELLQKYLEGKDIKDEVKIDQISDLYLLHQTFDIPEILQILYEKIDFYSTEFLDWNDEKKLLPYLFWKKVADLYKDEKLASLCEEKVGYMSAIDNELEKSEVACARAKKTYITGVCRLHFFPTAPKAVALNVHFKSSPIHQNNACLKERLIPVKALAEKKLGESGLSSITLDFQDVPVIEPGGNLSASSSRWIELFHHFLTPQIKLSCALVLKNMKIEHFSRLMWHSNNVDQSFLNLLSRLTLAYQQVRFDGIICRTIYDSINFVKKFKSENFRINAKVICQPDSKIDRYAEIGSDNTLTILCQGSKESKFDLTLCDLPIDTCFNSFRYAIGAEPLTIAFSHSQTNKRVWDLYNIAKMDTRILTIENACLNALFMTNVSFERACQFENLTELTHLTLINCQITPKQKQIIEHSIHERNRLKLHTDEERRLTIIESSNENI